MKFAPPPLPRALHCCSPPASSLARLLQATTTTTTITGLSTLEGFRTPSRTATPTGPQPNPTLHRNPHTGFAFRLPCCPAAACRPPPLALALGDGRQPPTRTPALTHPSPCWPLPHTPAGSHHGFGRLPVWTGHQTPNPHTHTTAPHAHPPHAPCGCPRRPPPRVSATSSRAPRWSRSLPTSP